MVVSPDGLRGDPYLRNFDAWRFIWSSREEGDWFQKVFGIGWVPPPPSIFGIMDLAPDYALNITEIRTYAQKFERVGVSCAWFRFGADFGATPGFIGKACRFQRADGKLVALRSLSGDVSSMVGS